MKSQTRLVLSILTALFFYQSVLAENFAITADLVGELIEQAEGKGCKYIRSWKEDTCISSDRQVEEIKESRGFCRSAAYHCLALPEAVRLVRGSENFKERIYKTATAALVEYESEYHSVTGRFQVVFDKLAEYSMLILILLETKESKAILEKVFEPPFERSGLFRRFLSLLYQEKKNQGVASKYIDAYQERILSGFNYFADNAHLTKVKGMKESGDVSRYLVQYKEHVVIYYDDLLRGYQGILPNGLIQKTYHKRISPMIEAMDEVLVQKLNKEATDSTNTARFW